MGSCENCGGCKSCGGCGSLLLTQAEIQMLEKFAQIPFLPVARRADDTVPMYLEEAEEDPSLVLACLEKKGLIDIDYHMPLSGFDYSAYARWPLHGSMALTARGQEVLDTLQWQGAAQEE